MSSEPRICHNLHAVGLKIGEYRKYALLLVTRILPSVQGDREGAHEFNYWALRIQCLVAIHIKARNIRIKDSSASPHTREYANTEDENNSPHHRSDTVNSLPSKSPDWRGDGRVLPLINNL